MNQTTELQNKCKEACARLNIRPEAHKIVFIYCPPKVGSTTIVTSLRIFCQHDTDIIHVHGNESFKVLADIKDVDVLQVIHYLASLGKNVKVIDVFRFPIERLMSFYFENIAVHFNNSAENINQSYPNSLLITRFNNLFLQLKTPDYFHDRYGIRNVDDAVTNSEETGFPTCGYIMIKQDNISFIKLRLCDSENWSRILTTLFRRDIRLLTDYTTSMKTTNQVYENFKQVYQIPRNFLVHAFKNPSYLRYTSVAEREQYERRWTARACDIYTTYYSAEEYRLYVSITMENMHVNCVQLNHYFDNGCLCASCFSKRRKVATLLLKGLPVQNEDRIVHTISTRNSVKQYQQQPQTQNQSKNKWAIQFFLT